MKIQEIERLTEIELLEMLSLNTQALKYKADDMTKILEETFEDYKGHRNYLLEKKQFWFNVFVYVFGMSPALMDVIVTKLNWFYFILWCEDNLLKHREIAYLTFSYEEFKKDRSSTASILNDMLDSVLESFTEIQPEQIQMLFDQLEDKVKKLPDFITKAI
jgi:hypothetical protein